MTFWDLIKFTSVMLLNSEARGVRQDWVVVPIQEALPLVPVETSQCSFLLSEMLVWPTVIYIIPYIRFHQLRRSLPVGSLPVWWLLPVIWLPEVIVCITHRQSFTIIRCIWTNSCHSNSNNSSTLWCYQMVPALEVPKGRNEAMFMSKKIYVPDLPINNRPLSLWL